MWQIPIGIIFHQPELVRAWIKIYLFATLQVSPTRFIAEIRIRRI